MSQRLSRRNDQQDSALETLDVPEEQPQSPHTTAPTLPNLDLDPDPRGRSYWWLWIIILGVIAYGCYLLYNFENSKRSEQKSARTASTQQHAIPVVAASARSGNMPVYLEGLGTVTAANTVTVRPRVDGQLLSVDFQEGQFVHQGAVLATIDPHPFQVALLQAQGALAEAKGTLVKDQAALRDALAIYERDQELYREQIIAKQQLDTQLASADQIRGTIEADQATISAAQSTIEAAKLNLSYTKILAPLSGRIGLRLVDAGNMIHATDATGIAVIAQIQPISVLFTVPEDQLPGVLQRLQSRDKLRVEAYDRDQRKLLATGTLLTVDNQIDTTTGTSRLKAVFANQDLSLFPNQFVNARLWLNTEKNVTIVPSVAVQRGPSGAFVYLVQPDSTVIIRSIKIGMSQGEDVSVDDGIKPGDQVVVDGAEKLTDGMTVKVMHPSSAK